MTTKKDIDYLERGKHLKKMFPDLEVKLAGSWVWISGNTKPLRKELKAQGLMWSPKKEKWYLKGKPCSSKTSMPWDYIVSRYGLEEIQEATI